MASSYISWHLVKSQEFSSLHLSEENLNELLSEVNLHETKVNTNTIKKSKRQKLVTFGRYVADQMRVKERNVLTSFYVLNLSSNFKNPHGFLCTQMNNYSLCNEGLPLGSFLFLQNLRDYSFLFKVMEDPELSTCTISLFFWKMNNFPVWHLKVIIYFSCRKAAQENTLKFKKRQLESANFIFKLCDVSLSFEIRYQTNERKNVKQFRDKICWF